MRLKQLEYLLGVKKYGSMNMAANKLYVSQQAISHAIKALEEEYQLPLIKCVPHKTLLTENGEIIVQVATEIFAKIEEMENRLHRRKQHQTEKYIVLADSSLKQVLPKLAMHLYSQYPYSLLKVHENSISEMIQAIVDLEVDIGIVNTWEKHLPLSLPPSIGFDILQRNNLYAFVHTQSPLAKYRTLSIKSIAQYPIALFGQTDSTEYTMDDIFRAYLPDAAIDYLYNVPKELISEIVRTQNAIVLIPSASSHAPFMENCVGIKLKENIIFCNGYFTRSDTVFSDSFREMLKSALCLT